MKKGSIFLFDLSVGFGHEQHGKRPAVLVSAVLNGMLVVVPLTGNLKSLKFSHTLSIVPSAKNKLDSESVALIFQLKSIDKRRAIQRIGRLDSSDQKQLNQILKDMLVLN